MVSMSDTADAARLTAGLTPPLPRQEVPPVPDPEPPAQEKTVKSYEYGKGKGKKLIKTNTKHALADRIGPGMQAGDKIKVLAIFENGDVIIEHMQQQNVLDESRNWVKKDMPVTIRVPKAEFIKHV